MCWPTVGGRGSADVDKKNIIMKCQNVDKKIGFFSPSLNMPIILIWRKKSTLSCFQFFLNLNFSFLFLVLYCLETCVNYVANCVTQNLPPWGSNFTKQILMSFYGSFRKCFYISEHILSKQFILNLNFSPALCLIVSRNMILCVGSKHFDPAALKTDT